MNFGITFFLTDQTIGITELAQEVESAGFESLWLPEHSHIPVSRRTPWGGVAGAAPLPDYYSRTLDVMVALGAAAAVTTRLKLATGITLVAQRDHVWLAKEVASLDYLSRGRMIFGIGYGWNKEEMASHGVRYGDRRRLLREKVLLMKELWTKEVAEYDGELIQLEPSWAWPKPVQQPHPPIILGADAGPKTMAHLVEFCDGWIPLGRHDLKGKLAEVRAAVAGRESFEVTSFSTRPDAEVVAELTGLGIDRITFNIPPKGRSEVLQRLEQLTRLVGEVS
ncbi:MAG TPA: LLM class F420-dependent oxidoreductase [Acidimicrobiia bacterium]|nr:LLM class F420-dependent oxidoreductase [Acidimicrobiia bacterium]